MKTLIKAIAVTFALGYTTLYAGSGHSHEHSGHNHAQTKVSKAEAQNIAKEQLASLVQKNKISESWSTVAISDTQKKMFNHHEEWVVSFLNTNISDKSKQTLYIFVSQDGKVTGANHTGQ